MKDANGAVLQEYTYNANNQRIKKSAKSNASAEAEVTYYYRDASDLTLAEYNKNGVIKYEYVYLIQASGLDGMIARINSEGEYEYFFKDHLGSTRQFGDNTSAVDYFPFGEKLTNSGGDEGTDYLFSGKERDQDTLAELDYFGARYYMASIGRWLVPDAFAGKYPTLSPYQYAANNPIRMIDVNGDSIIIADDGKEYEYRDGILYIRGTDQVYEGHIRKGGGIWGSIKRFFAGKYKGYTGSVYSKLLKIEQGGSGGAKLIGDLVNDNEATTIIQDLGNKKSSTFNWNTADRIRNVYWNNSDVVWGGDRFGNQLPISGIASLAHELGHSWDSLDGKMDINEWFTSGTGVRRTKDEMPAMGIENIIRGEHNLTKRKYYYIDASRKRWGELPNDYKVPGFNN